MSVGTRSESETRSGNSSESGSEAEAEAEAEEVAEEEEEIEIVQGIPLIAIDLFVRKKNRQRLTFTDTFGNLVYQLTNRNRNRNRVLCDPSGNPLISIFRSPEGLWKGFRGDGFGQELLFTVEQTLNTFSKIEFNINLVKEDERNLDFAMRGCLFWRSCTIYQDNSIIAQTNLMYKLGFRKYFVRRDKFRVTVFPGFADYNFIAALILVFLDGRKQ